MHQHYTGSPPPPSRIICCSIGKNLIRSIGLFMTTAYQGLNQGIFPICYWMVNILISSRDDALRRYLDGSGFAIILDFGSQPGPPPLAGKLLSKQQSCPWQIPLRRLVGGREGPPKPKRSAPGSEPERRRGGPGFRRERWKRNGKGRDPHSGRIRGR